MSIFKRLFTIHVLFLCLFLKTLFCETDAIDLEVLNVEKLCINDVFKVNLDMRFHESFILKAGTSEPLECVIELNTYRNHSVAISIGQYNLGESDSLVFRDTRGIELSLKGSGLYEKEEKSFIFEGPLTVHYATNHSMFSLNKVIFEFVFTSMYDLRGDDCHAREFKCANDKCIQSSLVCNDHNNCGDRSDEKNCNKCIAEQFQCHNEKCLPGHYVCDGHNDCGDYSDETDCRRSCLSNEYQCSNKKCVLGSQVCDKINSCGDLSDETDCFQTCLPRKEFRCQNSKCIPMEKVCDGYNDCGDRTDERYCSSKANQTDDEIPELRMPILGIVIITAVATLVLTVSITLCIVYCRKKETQQPVDPTSQPQQAAPASFGDRMRQSLRWNRQATAPPLEMASPTGTTTMPESFRSDRQPGSPPPNTTSVPVSRPGESRVSSIYPHVPSGVDNPTFKVQQ